MYGYIYRITLPVKYILILAFCLLSAPTTWSQDKIPVFKNFSKELVSSETYDLAQDIHGKIWIVSDRGLNMFDGKNFHTIETHRTIQTNAIFGLKKKNEHSFWLITKRNELFYFDPLANKVELTPFKHSEKIRNIVQSYPTEQYINNISFQNDSVYISFLKPDRIIIGPKGNITNSNVDLSIYHNSVEDNLILHDDPIHPYTIYDKADNKRFKIQAKKPSGEIINLVNNPSFIISYKMNSVSMFGEQGGFKYFSIGRYIIQKSVNSEYKTLALDSEILDFDFNGDDLVVGTFKGVYEVDSSLAIQEHYLKDQSISSVLRDKDGGFWFTTLGKGVFYTPNINLKTFNGTEDFLLKSITPYRDKVICNDNNLMTYVIEDKKLIKFGYLVQLGELFRHPDRSAESYLGQSFYDPYSSTFNYVPNKKEKAITAYGKFIRIHEKGLVETYRYDSTPYILCCHQLNDSTALFGTADGVMHYVEGNKPKKYTIKDQEVLTDVREIINVGGQFVYLVNDGIIIENETETYRINDQNGLENNYLSGICLAGNNSFWAFGNGGINLIHLNSIGFKIQRFREFKFLPSKEISAFAVQQDNLYIGTKNGVCHINRSELTDSPILQSEHFTIDSILSGGNSLNITDTLKLSADNDGLSFYFNYLNFSDCDIHVEYQYDVQGQWIQTNESSIHLTTIPFGTRKISFRATFEEELLKLGSFIIIVPTPISSQSWFIPVLMLVAIIPLFILFRWFLIRRQKKEQEKTKLEMSLLSSRMNPHFTFNTISSIQSYILKNEKAPAIQYLSDFGLLMRKSLDYSYKDYINISDELDFLKLLVTLENKRFDSDFQLKIIRKDKGRDFKVPAMLIQPMVENVILHCIFPKDSEKAIYIEIDETVDHHIITIEDFGMNHEVKSKKNHESHGLSIVRDRLRLHNGKHYSEENFTTLKKTGPGQHGYKVTIKLLKK